MSSDHHSEYLARAIAALTPEGHARVDELLEGLAQVVGNREWLARFAQTRRAEADSGRLAPAPDAGLTEDDIGALLAGFKTIRDTEQLDDVTDWANAVVALLQDEAEA